MQTHTPIDTTKLERHLLGAMIVDPRSLAFASPRMYNEDFQGKSHRLIFQALKDRFDEGLKVDLLGLFRDLEMSGWLERAGGRRYIVDLVKSVPDSNWVWECFQLIKEVQFYYSTHVDLGFICPVCLTEKPEHPDVRNGDRCSDESHGQVSPCRGRIMYQRDWRLAEFEAPFFSGPQSAISAN